MGALLQLPHRQIPVARPGGREAEDPASLHKYLYANGDPVNRIDPRGKDAVLEYVMTEDKSEETVWSWKASLDVYREELYLQFLHGREHANL